MFAGIQIKDDSVKTVVPFFTYGTLTIFVMSQPHPPVHNVGEDAIVIILNACIFTMLVGNVFILTVQIAYHKELKLVGRPCKVIRDPSHELLRQRIHLLIDPIAGRGTRKDRIFTAVFHGLKAGRRTDPPKRAVPHLNFVIRGAGSALGPHGSIQTVGIFCTDIQPGMDHPGKTRKCGSPGRSDSQKYDLPVHYNKREIIQAQRRYILHIGILQIVTEGSLLYSLQIHFSMIPREGMQTHLRAIVEAVGNRLARV